MTTFLLAAMYINVLLFCFSLEKNCGVELNLSPSLELLVEAEAIRLIIHLAKYVAASTVSS